MEDSGTVAQGNPFTANDYTPPPPGHEEATQIQRDISDRASDVTKPGYPITGDEKKDAFLFDVPQDLRQRFDTACADTAPSLSDQARIGDDDWIVFEHLLRVLSSDIPLHISNPNAADCRWAWMRCICAGAGYLRHRDCCAVFEPMFPWFPWDADEDHATWLKNLHGAHQICGYPVGFAWLDFGEVSSMYPAEKRQGPPPIWMRRLAMIHFHKYARYCTYDEYPACVVMYMGSHLRSKINASGEPIPRNKSGDLSKLLRGGIDHHQPSVCLAHAIHSTPVISLLRTESASKVNPRILIAPNACRLPFPPARDGFIRTGLAVKGAWQATGGKVYRIDGGHRLVLGTHIRQGDGAVDDFAARIPTSYQTTQLPSVMMIDAFPNVVIGYNDIAAWHAYLSAMLLSGLIDGGGKFRRERPFIVAQPLGDTLDESTGNGKTTLALALAQVYAPGINKAYRVADGAPAARAIAATIERHGTVALDEFDFPKDSSHITSEQNMLAIATGNASSPGKVYSNEEQDLEVRAPIFASAKFWDGKDDMFKRTFPIFLDQFSKMQGMSFDGHSRIVSGEWALEMRLSMLHLIDLLGLEATLRAASVAGSPFAPFPCIRWLAAAILRVFFGVKTDADATQQVDDLIKWLMKEQRYKLERFSASGGKQGARGQGRPSISIDALTNDLTSSEFDTFMMTVNGETGGSTPRQIFNAYKIAKGAPNALDAHVFEELTGDPNVSGRRVSVAISEALARLMPTIGDTYRLPGVFGVCDNWHIERLNERARTERYKLVQLTPAQSNPITPVAQENSDDNDTTEAAG